MYINSKVNHSLSLENKFYDNKKLENVVKTFKNSVTEKFISKSSKNVFLPPEELVVEENSLELFPENPSFSLVTKDEFKQLMKSRTGKLQEVCNRTLEFKRKFNFRSIYVLQVQKNKHL